MTVILDNGQKFRITKIMGVERNDTPTAGPPTAGPLAVFFEPIDKSTVAHRGWWWVDSGLTSDYLLDDRVSMEQKEKRLLELMAGRDNRWYRYTGKNDRHNADLIPQEKGE